MIEFLDWKTMAIQNKAMQDGSQKEFDVRDYSRRRLKAKIMSLLLSSPNSGMSEAEVCEELSKIVRRKKDGKKPIDKKYVRRYLEELIEEKAVRKEVGKFGKYYPNLKLKDNYFLESTVYSGELAAFFDQYRKFVTGMPPWNTNCRNLEDFKQLIPAFSTRLGAIMTYLLIQSMNISNNIIAGGNSKSEKDILVKKWVKDIFSHMAVDILESFRFSIQDLLVAEDKRETSLNIDLKDLKEEVTIEDLSDVIPAYTLGDKVISDLETAFFNSYPTLFPHLHKMQSELPQLTKKPLI
jgi:hypothetical protein